MPVLRLKNAASLLFVGAIGFGAVACSAGPMVEAEGRLAKVAEADVIAFSGKVIWLDLEGGFWGIETAQGKQLLPMALPEAFKKDGLQVRGQFLVLKDVMTIQMWGTPVELSHIEAVAE